MCSIVHMHCCSALLTSMAMPVARNRLNNLSRSLTDFQPVLPLLQVSWLLNLSGHAFQPPQQYDDPNITCTNIMSALREAGFAPASFSPAKLRQGHGEPVCGVLSALCDLALERQQFRFQAPQFQEEQ